jgi:hypothetical protein
VPFGVQREASQGARPVDEPTLQPAVTLAGCDVSDERLHRRGVTRMTPTTSQKLALAAAILASVPSKTPGTGA